MKLILGLFVVFLAGLWVYAIPAVPVQRGKVLGVDRTFAVQAAAANMAEVQLGQLAQDKGASDFVREFGSMMVKDHGESHYELRRLAASKQIRLTDRLSVAHQATYTRLSNLRGAAFDQAYKSAMMKDHEQGIKAFTAYLRSGKDVELKAFAQKSLPTKKRHLQILRSGKLP